MNEAVTLSDGLTKKAQRLLPIYYGLVGYTILAKALQAQHDNCDSDPIVDIMLKSLSKSVLLEWYKLFDVRMGNQYWKQITVEQKEYRDQLYVAANLDYNGWTDFRNQLSEWRNQIFDSRDTVSEIATISKEIPFDQMLKILAVTHDWLFDLLKESISDIATVMKDIDYIDELSKQADLSIARLTTS